MSEIKRVLIVGSGIAGATLAYALRRFDISAHLIEMKPESSAAGTGISLMYNTVRALRMIDLADRCLERGQLTERFRQFDRHGNQLSVNPTPTGFGIRRPDLANVLETAAVEAGAVVDWGVTVESLEDLGDRVSVVFSDGRRAEYDLVVAADGVYSKLRAKVFGPQFAAEYVGQSAWRFVGPRAPEHDGFFLWRNELGQGLGGIPISKDLCYLFILETHATHPRMPPDQLHTLIRERVLARGYTAPQILNVLDHLSSPEQVGYRPFDVRLMPGPWWHKGRVVLIGDAAHAPTPQLTSGGGMAIEDAVVLAECLHAPGSAAEALEAFSRRRMPRVNRVWAASRQICQWEMDDPIGTADQAAALLLQTYQFLGEPI